MAITRYPSKFLNRLQNADLEKWREQGIDFVGRLVAETKKRGLEVFWHHRVSEVDINTAGTGAAWKDGPAPLKRAHPDWILKTDRWRHGLWNFAVPAVREHTVQTLREVAERYDLDGIQNSSRVSTITTRPTAVAMRPSRSCAACLPIGGSKGRTAS